jgi:hypothetical protein
MKPFWNRGLSQQKFDDDDPHPNDARNKLLMIVAIVVVVNVAVIFIGRGIA